MRKTLTEYDSDGAYTADQVGGVGVRPNFTPFLDGLLQLRDQTVRINNPVQVSLPQEYEFRPTLAGKLRSLWHGVASKWALRHAQQQQNTVNQTLADALAAHAANDQAAHAEYQQLLTYCISLERRLKRAEQRFEELEANADRLMASHKRDATQ